METMWTKANPLTIAGLTQRIKGHLEQGFHHLWVVGEISNFKRASSGHWYFSLKDESAQIRCNMWRSKTGSIGFQPKDGAEVLIYGGLNVYAPRGEYSLIVEQMEERGQGRLRQEFERLKAMLGKEGLFDREHKKPLPFFPRKIGLVTSPTGAAIRDMLSVLCYRFPGIHILICPARVQGRGSAEEIAAAIRILDQEGHCDLIIAGRGGGSEEDLWSFNEEIVARAIYEARTPIISAVGHETDFTIADFVADIRAATPSNAAELAIRTQTEYAQLIAIHRKNLDQIFQNRILRLKNRVRLSESHPIFLKIRSRVNDRQRRLTDLEYQAKAKIEAYLGALQIRLLHAANGLKLESLTNRLENLSLRLERANIELKRAMAEGFEQRQMRAAHLIERLEDLSPLKILGRGYAAIFNRKRKIVRGPEDVALGEIIEIRLARGDLNARVIEKEREAIQPELF